MLICYVTVLLYAGLDNSVSYLLQLILSEARIEHSVGDICAEIGDTKWSWCKFNNNFVYKRNDNNINNNNAYF